LDAAYNLIHSIYRYNFYDSICPWIRSIAYDKEKKRLIVGTFGSEIFEFRNNYDKILLRCNW